MFYEVIPGKRIGGLNSALTYSFDGQLLQKGTIVEIPIGKSRVAGVVYKKVAQPDFKTREITRILYSVPLPTFLVDTAEWMAEYYLVPITSIIGMILPNGVLKRRRAYRTEPNKNEQISSPALPNNSYEPRPCLRPSDMLEATTSYDLSERSDLKSRDLGVKDYYSSELCDKASNPLLGASSNSKKTEQTSDTSIISLNNAQKNAILALQKAREATRLLFGVTGSGKTNIYMYEAARALEMGKSVIVLVPEIALTEQLVRVFRDKFGEKVVLIHSQQAEAQRHSIFESILMSPETKVVIGPRSALFAPLKNLGLIVIDEEHEGSYYQDSSPKYSAIRTASFIAKRVSCPLILGSATPAIEDYYVAKKKGSLVVLNERAKTAATDPTIKIVDLRDKGSFTKNRYFSNDLIRSIRENLENGQQTLIFHNRRGTAPLTICEHCGEEIDCPNCLLPLTLHADSYELYCHTCGFRQKVPVRCPKCGASELRYHGFGTKLLENELNSLFPKAIIRRFDADNKKGESLAATYAEVYDGDVDILVGTQTLAKGLDLPRLATVGVVQADAGLALPDFSSEERTFQLLTQVFGRVGRGHTDKAEVIIQTFRPDHPVITYARTLSYENFSNYLLDKRRKSGFPPFYFIAKAEVTMKTEKNVIKKVNEAVGLLSNSGLIISPPLPAFHEREGKGYTWQIILRAKSRRSLLVALAKLDKHFRVTLDPPSLL
ncbi:MAG: primosomal protein N' [Candidatus Saccharibacteria bacterium]|nr:primosomal protein N' [Candidatus Saccharibacteria bacterium]